MEPLTLHAASVDFAPQFSARWSAGASDPERLDEAHRLRFGVYCVDCGFLDAADYPDGRERDIHDDGALHFYAYNQTRELVGYVRLVRPTEGGRFPWQLHCLDLLPGVVLPARHESAEVSRLMVRRDYRRRRGDLIHGVNTLDGDSLQPEPACAPVGPRGIAAREDDPGRGEDRRNRSPQIMLSLYRRMYQQSLPAGIRYWYAAMEKPLARALQAMGFTFQRIGPETDYFGPVAPYLADLRQLEARLSQRNPALLRWMKSL
jgi:N-acyl-L-homoserine lactone synthetase